MQRINKLNNLQDAQNELSRSTYAMSMKIKTLILLVILFQASILFGGESIQTIDQEFREEVLNGIRQYRFYKYTEYSSGFYTVSSKTELDDNTSIRMVSFIDSGNLRGKLEFNYSYHQSINNLYFDSVLTFIADEEEIRLFDDTPDIYGNLFSDSFFSFNFWLTELRRGDLRKISESKNLKLKIDETILNLSLGQIKSIQQYIKFILLTNLTDADIEYLSSIVTIEYVDFNDPKYRLPLPTTDKIIAPAPEPEPFSLPTLEPALETDLKPLTISLLFDAIENNQIDYIKQAMVSKIDLKGINDEGFTPLLWAALKSSNPEVISLLIGNGADINKTDTLGRTPLIISATYNENVEILKRLIESGADPNSTSIDKDSDTALYGATIFNPNLNII